MTLRSAICFSLIAAHAMAAVVSGKFVLRDSRLSSVRNGHDYSGVVISFVPVGNKTPQPLPKPAIMVQKGKTFTPHILPVVEGTVVEFPNFDPIFHNAFSSYSGQIFDVGLYPPGTSRGVKFLRPGIVRVFCNIHPTMSAVIVVLDTPYFTTSAKDGTWQINLPRDTYDVSVFHERATPATLKALARQIAITDERVNLGVISVSESGYLPGAHKNKFGKDYPPSEEENSLYPGVRK